MKITGSKTELIKQILDLPDEDYDCEIVKHREKRSLNANAYAWVLMDKIAKAVKAPKEAVYLQMIERYGSFIYLPAQEKDMEMLKNVFRVIRDRGEIVLTTPSWKRVTCRQLQCYKGSSTFDTKEMAEFIDGIVSEAMDLGIETETPDEIRRMKEQWGANL